MHKNKFGYEKIERYASNGVRGIYLVLQCCVRLLALMIPYSTELLIDSISHDTNQGLAYCSAALMIIVISYVILLTLSFYTKVRYEDAKITMMKSSFAEKLNRIPLREIQKNGTGYYIQRFTTDIEGCREFLIDKPINFYLNFIYGAGIVVEMLCINTTYALTLLLAFPVLAWLYWYLAKKISAITRDMEAIHDNLNSLFEETLSCNYTIRANNAEGWFSDQMNSMLTRSFFKTREYNRIEAVYDYMLITGLMNLMTVSVYIIGGYLVFGNRISFGMIVSMSLLFSRLWTPVEFYLDFPKRRAKYLVHKKRLEELDAAEENSSTPFMEPFQTLELRKVSYLADERLLFKDVCLKITPKEHICISGSNGSGKTTIANMIAALQTEYSGTILYNGTDYKDLNPRDIREHICLIPAKAEIFAGTVKDNLLMGASGEIPDAVMHILNQKGITLQKVLQENGTNLSSGEAKLIQLARGFCRNCEVYIIDEPLNFIDKEYVELVLNSINELFAQKTFLLISHDPRTADLCSKQYLLDSQRLTLQ